MKTIHDSMMNCFNRLHIVGQVVGLVALLSLTACSATIDSDLGYEMIPDHQKMEIRHLRFKGGKVIKFNAAASNDNESHYDERDVQFF